MTTTTFKLTPAQEEFFADIQAFIEEKVTRRGEVLEVRLNAQQVAFTNYGECDPEALPLSAELETLSEEISEAEKAQRLAFAPVKLNYSHAGA